MANKAPVRARIEAELKEEVEKLFKELGIQTRLFNYGRQLGQLGFLFPVEK